MHKFKIDLRFDLVNYVVMIFLSFFDKIKIIMQVQPRFYTANGFVNKLGKFQEETYCKQVYSVIGLCWRFSSNMVKNKKKLKRCLQNVWYTCIPQVQLYILYFTFLALLCIQHYMYHYFTSNFCTILYL